MRPYKLKSKPIQNKTHKIKNYSNRNYNYKNRVQSQSFTKGILLFWILPVAVSAVLLYNSTDFFYKDNSTNNNGKLEYQRSLTEGFGNKKHNVNSINNANTSKNIYNVSAVNSHNITGNQNTSSQNEQTQFDSESIQFEIKNGTPKLQVIPSQSKTTGNHSDDGLSVQPNEVQNQQQDNIQDIIEVPVHMVKMIGSKPLLYPVKRKVKNKDSIKASVNALLSGPTDKEKNNGLRSFLPTNAKLINYKTKGNRIYLNFNEEFTFTNPKIAKLKIAQIVATMTSRKSIKEVVFLVNNKKVDFLDNEGLIRNKVMTQNNTLKKTK